MYEQYMETVYARLDKYTEKTDGCWNWTGAKDSQGYGVLTLRRPIKKVVKAHRLSWQRVNGPIPETHSYHGTCILHSCDNPGCVNPKHLFAGTVQDNLQDMKEKERGRGPTKLSAALVHAIRAQAEVIPQVEICRIHGLHSSTVSGIVNRKVWDWLK